jgi:CBS domain-containing protein
MEVRNLIGGSATVCGPELSLLEAASTMIAEGIGSLGVVDNGRLVGIFTERDALRALADGADPNAATVEAWMTIEPDAVTPDVDVEEVADWLLGSGYRHIPVVEGDTLLGVVSIKDVLWALKEAEGVSGS